uniref:Glyco_18 domain-containing protein n=1 Tax=Meloidogyne hapla TaxID=6305 RepID=A0A1I8C191_MELHA
MNILIIIFILQINLFEKIFCSAENSTVPQPPPPKPPSNVRTCNFVGDTTGYLRPCYFTNWAQNREGRAKFVPENYVPGLCTHIIYAFAQFNSSFIPSPSNITDLPNESDLKGLYQRVLELKNYDYALKVIISFGEWTFSQTSLFEDMMSRNLLKHLKKIITAAVSAGIETAEQSYDIANMSNYVEFVNLMTYDFHVSTESVTGYNSPLFTKDDLNIDSAADYWFIKGMPKNKIVIGLATYGHGWTLADPNAKKKPVGINATGPSKPTEFVKEEGIGAYYEFCEMLTDRSTKHAFDMNAKVPFLVYQNDQWFSFDNIRSFKAKIDWIKANGYGGAYVWTLDFDDFNGQCTDSEDGIYPLIGTIARRMGGIKGPLVPISSSTERPI